MRYTIIKQVSTILIVMTAFPLLAQNSELRNLEDFSAVKVGEGISLTLISGNETKAKVSSNGIELDKVLTRVSAGRLKIYLQSNNHRHVDVEVQLTYKQIESIDIGSAAKVVSRGAIKGSSLSLEISSAGEGKIEVDVDELTIDISSAGNLTLSGKADTQDVVVSSAGSYMAYELSTKYTTVRANSAGTAKVWASESIDANANSAGKIKYKGSPDKVYVSSNSGGHAGKAN